MNYLRMTHFHKFVTFSYWAVIATSFLVAFAFAKDKDSKKNVLAPLADISFDISNEIVESGVMYAVSMEENVERRPRFSIHPESEFRRRDNILARGIWQDKVNQTGEQSWIRRL